MKLARQASRRRDARLLVSHAVSSSVDRQSSRAEADEDTVEQPPVEDLGEVPRNAKPFCWVKADPGVATPASKAGLRRGDAILSLGRAVALHEIQDELQAAFASGAPLPTHVIDASGRYLCKSVLPRVWDRWAPASLLGCELADSCPLDLVGVHPVSTTRSLPGGQLPPPTPVYCKQATGASLLTGRHRVDSLSGRSSHVRVSTFQHDEDEGAEKQHGGCQCGIKFSLSGIIIFLLSKFSGRRAPRRGGTGSANLSAVKVKVQPTA